MDLAQLTADLDALRERATGAASAAPGHGGARRARARGPGQEGRADRDPARDRRAARRGPAEGRRDREQGAPARRGGARRGAHDALGGAELSARLTAEAVDVTTPGRPIRRGTPPPDRRDGPRDRRRVRAVRVRRLRGPGDRGRRHQLPDAQHPARPPGAGPVGHAVPRRRGPPAPDAHEPGPDPGDAPGAAADPRAAARSLLPLRGGGREPRERVLPGRGPDDRRGHVDGRPQGPARPVRPRDVRRGPRNAVPPRLLPVHRAVGRVRHPVRHLRRREVPGLLDARAG